MDAGADRVLCTACKTLNIPSNPRCYRCGTPLEQPGSKPPRRTATSGMERIQCDSCGETNFAVSAACWKCGENLHRLPVSTRSPQPAPAAEPIWTDKCPACGLAPLAPFTKSALLGLVRANGVVCTNCGATFLEMPTGYQLAAIADPLNLVWQEYSNVVLPPQQWRVVGDEGTEGVRRKQVARHYWLDQVAAGATRLDFGVRAPVIPRSGEGIVFACPGVTLWEPRAVRTGGYAGPTIRLAKGLSFHVGAFASSSHDEMRHLDTGILSLTTKRLVFSGSLRSAACELAKMVSVEPYSDGIGVASSNRSRKQYFTGIDQHTVTYSLDGRSYVDRFSGPLLVRMIEGLQGVMR